MGKDGTTIRKANRKLGKSSMKLSKGKWDIGKGEIKSWEK